MSTSHIGASIEVSAKHVHDGKLHSELLPKGTRVYITDVGVDPVADLISAARKVTDMGYQTVPHTPARRIESVSALESRLAGMVNEAGVEDILIIAGEADEQMGPFSETLAVLQTGLIDKLGIKHVAVGGHPEGNPRQFLAFALGGLAGPRTGPRGLARPLQAKLRRREATLRLC